tara:strand:- start:907 stop:1098 length:192 start_codon:yes stop_codon:yes gene_type:complete
MNINIYKNLYANAYKPIGRGKPFNGEWQRRVLTDIVGSISRLPVHPIIVKPTTATNKYRRNYD